MNRFLSRIALLLCGVLGTGSTQAQEEGLANNRYLWEQEGGTDTVRTRIGSPPGYVRTAVTPLGWSEWLRYLPVKEENVVHYYNDDTRSRAKAATVINMPVGKTNLRHAAEMIIQLRAEYHYSIRKHGAIHPMAIFGQPLPWVDWARGKRLTTERHRPKWVQREASDSTYPNFQAYLETILHHVGTVSLAEQTSPVYGAADARIGDVFVRPGFPGHAVLIGDMVEHPVTGQRAVLLAQGNRPAQAFHVVLNPAEPKKKDPWFYLSNREKIVTPDGTFSISDLRRF